MGRGTMLPVAALIAVACDAPFDDRDHVDRLRVLAVRAEPPEIAPGGGASLTALVVAPGGEVADASVVWRACVVPWRGEPGGGFDGFAVPGPALDDGAVGCDDAAAAMVTALGEGASARLDVAVDAFDDALVVAYGEVAVAQRAQLEAIAGVPWRVELTVRRGDEVVRASKIVRVSRRARPNDNPPEPIFDGAPCGAGELDGRSTVTFGATLPATFEGYQVLLPTTDDGRFEVLDRTELWTYSAFATDGDFEPEVVKVVAGEATFTWRRRRAADLWIVLRDGRGGTSWCHRTVAAPP